MLSINDDHVLLSCPDGTKLFGRLIDVEVEYDFTAVLQHHLPKDIKKRFISVATKLKLILERASTITDSSVDQTATKITVENERIRFYSKSVRGTVSDVMRIVAGNIDVVTFLEPGLLKSGIGLFDNVAFTESCGIFHKENKGTEYLYLVSAVE